MPTISKGIFEQYASSYGKEHNRLDYLGLAKLTGDMILCNNIPEVDPEIFENVECGDLYSYDDLEYEYEEYVEECKENNEEPVSYDDWFEEHKYEYERMKEIYQYWLVRDKYWLEQAEELVLYSEKLDCYVWCVDHWGTAWDYVLTSLEVEKKEAE